MIKRSFQYLVGDPEEFLLQSRIFHTFSLIAIISIFGQALFYQFTRLQEASLLSAMVGLAMTGLFYLSRFKNKLHLAVSLTVIALSITHVFGYMYNAGIAGNAMLLSVETLFLVLLVVPQKQRFFWFLLTVAVLLVMVYLEYLNPGIVKKGYHDRTEKYVDLVVTYLLAAVMIYIGAVMLRNNYNKQKDAAENKALKLTHSNQEKDKLFSIISHDLTAPMATVKQYLDLLQAVELDTEERKTIEQSLARSLNEANTLLNNLLLWAKNQMHLNYVQLETIHIKALLTETVDLYRVQADHKKISIKMCVEDDLHVKADQNMLNVVFRNLLNNAIKFSHLGGEIEFRAFSENNQCVISLKDHGIGITGDKQDKIFTLNISSSYGTANEKGTGLGLILSKDFMVQLGGDLWFNSTPWEGTTFYVSLPNA
ncbi:sensor histidine kinase [Pedobacter immunditicola]|uniref:sensor histidine kinase n=1 Tax=Pedobacter immunditicola TaxID=3133440 RepID=UPI0030AD7CFC